MMKKTLAFLLFALMLSPCNAYAQDWSQLSEDYFSKNDYDGFYAVLKAVPDPTAEVHYYLALTRQKNIDFWNASKNWEGVFDQAAAFKKEILGDLKLAQGLLKNDPVLALKIKVLRWRRAREDDPDSADGLFSDLLKTAQDGPGSAAILEVIRSIADELSLLEDKNLARRLYEVYVRKLIASDLSKEELKEKGALFLARENVYLAKALFDGYLARYADTKALEAKERVRVADLFSHQDNGSGPDPVFAEEMYQKAVASEGVVCFESASQYRRAFNLERMKEYTPAAQEYKNLLSNFTDYKDKAAINFRLGVISAYAFRDFETAAAYFLKVKDDPAEGALALSALYQLGLLDHHKGDKEKAKEFYAACLEKAKGLGLDAQKNEICLMAQERLKEIEEIREMAHPLKLFFEGLAKKETFLFVDLTGAPPKQDPSRPEVFTVTTSNPQTGCMMPVYAYEWSGETGSTVNIANAPQLTTDYPSGRIKVVMVAVVGPKDLEGVGFDMVEVK
jgi:hypothetical protein